MTLLPALFMLLYFMHTQKLKVVPLAEAQVAKGRLYTRSVIAESSGTD